MWSFKRRKFRLENEEDVRYMGKMLGYLATLGWEIVQIIPIEDKSSLYTESYREVWLKKKD